MRRSSVGWCVSTDEWTSGIEGEAAFVFMALAGEFPV
jgi:hypothetical protein